MNPLKKIFNASKQNRPALEISGRSACGRMCDYCPQSEYNFSYKKIDSENSKLTLSQVIKIQKNIPIDTVIHWTGFVEPLELKDFSLICSFLHEKGYSQLLGTTLTGYKENINFLFDNFNIFDAGISLHLPDDEGLMKGKFDEQYSDNVNKLLRSLKEDSSSIHVSIALIGETFHRNILSVVEQYKHDFSITKTRALSTRSGLIDIKKFGYKDSKKLNKITGPYYCSIQRLNQGVLLPNGLVSICCQDFGLKHILGSLQDSNLEQLYSSIEQDSLLSGQFMAGEMEPCIHCEYYLPFAINNSFYKKIARYTPDFVKDYVNKYRNKTAI